MAAQPVVLAQLHRRWRSPLSLQPNFRCDLLINCEAREAILNVIYDVGTNRQLLSFSGLMFFAMSQTSWHGQGREDHKEYLSADVHHKGLQRPLVRTLPNQTPSAQQTCKFRFVAELEKTGTVKAGYGNSLNGATA